MEIDSNTKIGKIIKVSPEALEAIISISPKFEKLRNPVLRKIMAGRTTIAMAAKLGGCREEAFFRKLEPLGFVSNDNAYKEKTQHRFQHFYSFLNELNPDKVVTLDVRPVLEKGEDPLILIQKSVKGLIQGEILKLINTFEPTPLIALLRRQGFQAYVNNVTSEHVDTYFYKDSSDSKNNDPEIKKEGWEEMVLSFLNRLEEIDVRDLEMPAPMVVILETLDGLAPDKALYVFHKRVPLFLLPELKQRNYDYRIREISDNELHLLIFRQDKTSGAD